jgi:hypothetical protein
MLAMSETGKLTMLRKNGQSIFIEIPPSTEARTVEIVLKDSYSGQARITAIADKSIVIHRGQVHRTTR